MKHLALLLLLCAGLPAVAHAGPPYQLDDPDVIPFHHFEFYTFGTMASGPGAIGTAGPALELNWSGVHNVMFHFLVPVVSTAIPSDGPVTVGLGDSEMGLQYRFIQETKHRPMVGTFTMLEIPTGSASRGLGAGGFQLKLPIWMQKSVGGWTLNWGGGANISRIAGSRSYPFGGAMVQHDVGSRLTLGSEVFYHGRQAAAQDARYAAMVDVGGYYTLTDSGFQLLFCYGRSVAGQTENYGYLGLYWTWGPAGSGSHGG